MGWMPSTPHAQRKQLYRDVHNSMSHPSQTVAGIPMSGIVEVIELFHALFSFHGPNFLDQTYLSNIITFIKLLGVHLLQIPIWKQE
ncbi:hypothetical protein BDF19DRAFT_419439 [Syncephalis fuscata]|nr:hypothetical protein BDF19DRAFT_419439 [Syncephalis fuscata]